MPPARTPPRRLGPVRRGIASDPGAASFGGCDAALSGLAKLTTDPSEKVRATAIRALAARLEKDGVAVTSEPQTLADARRVRSLISFHDPAGNRLEALLK